MATVLISFLGTGPKKKGKPTREYEQTTYDIGGSRYTETSLAVGLAKHLQPDKVIIFGTVKSMWEELWQQVCLYKGVTVDEDKRIELYEYCSESESDAALTLGDLEAVLRKDLEPAFDIELIHYGVNQEQIEANFEIIAKKINSLEDGDELIIDITHSYRSLPLFTTTAINFINTVTDKDLSLSKIYYGMWEAGNDGVSHVVDLSYIATLQKWSQAGYVFKEYGETNLLTKLLEADNSNAAQILGKFSRMLATNYIHELKSRLQQLKSITTADFGEEGNLVVPSVIKAFLKRFPDKALLSSNQLALAEWHYEKHNYALSYICLVEAQVTKVCELEGLPTSGESARKQAKAYLHKEVKRYGDLLKIYGPANAERVTIAHVSASSRSSSSTAINNLKSYLPKTKRLFDML